MEVMLRENFLNELLSLAQQYNLNRLINICDQYISHKK